MTLDEMLALAKACSQEIVKKGEQHAPIVIFSGREAGAACIELPDKRAKEHFAETLRGLLCRFSARRYVFICEAWRATGKAAEQVVRSGSILDLPPDDREEVINIIAVENGGRALMCYAVILNHPEGRRLGEWSKVETPDMLSGRMVVTRW